MTETLEELKARGEAPEWMDQPGLKTIQGGYMLPNETPRGMYLRVANAAGSYYSDSEKWSKKFFEAMWNNWLCPATPVLSNLGTNRGLPISCNSIAPEDSLNSIFKKSHELAMLSKYGAGVGIYMGNIRGRGSKIKGNGESEGVVPWAKLYDTTTLVASQGGVRRGASVLYLPVDHPDFEEFLHIRRPTGDMNRRCLNVNIGACISDQWMEEMLAGDKAKRATWQKILTERVETGEPYIFFTDTVNKANPECYKANNLHVPASNLCSEIFLHLDPEHTFVCCLSSLNLVRYKEWIDTDLVNTSIRFLDAVLEEYIQKAEGKPGMEAALNSAKKGRALGLGVLGWHSLLQKEGFAFDSFDSMRLNALIFRTMREKADEETALLAQEKGEPEWCKGFGRRNTHTMACAPTVSNSTISGGHSPGIEPIASNYVVQKSAKGTFTRKNETLRALLAAKGKDTLAVWKGILKEAGSVQHLDFLSEQEKAVFLTAREISQFAIVKQASQRQVYIDQGQSTNLFFASNASAKYIHQVHVEAWKSGLKTLYYFRSEGVLRADMASRSKDEECVACEG